MKPLLRTMTSPRLCDTHCGQRATGDYVWKGKAVKLCIRCGTNAIRNQEKTTSQAAAVKWLKEQLWQSS
jgi:hypothetical protein